MIQVVRLSASSPVGRSAVALLPGAVGLHSGVYFRASSEQAKVIHLASHCRFRCGPEVSEWACVVPTIDEIDLQVLAGFCLLLERVRPQVPYGFGFRASHFDGDGRFVPGPGELGLTCSTFVLAVFEWARIPLVLKASWVAREDDAAAQKRLLDLLAGRATPEHLDAIEREVGCVRFRCEEIAAASAYAKRPVPMEIAARGSVQVRASLAQLPPAARIAVIGWGSLVWNPGDLELTSKWTADGPVLPIEFSRISRDRRLTLVLDGAAGVLTKVWYATVGYDAVDAAVSALARRERTAQSKIGLLDLRVDQMRANNTVMAATIKAWAKARGFDAVLWTDLEPNFPEVRSHPFSVATAVAHVLSLTGESRKEALEYIAMAPQEVDTPVRRSLALALGSE